MLALMGMALMSQGQEHLEHKTWTKLLKKYVTEDGHVNYAGIKTEEKVLDDYLTVLSQNHPEESWKKEDQLAYWINAYNAFTVKLIVKNLPVKSIKDLGGGIYKVNTPWDIKFIKIGDETYDLNNIEHGIVRKQFNDPRVHFALNCASVSCPRLRNEAYVGSKINEQLDDQSKYFINNKSKNHIMGSSASISKIFDWFNGDFKETGGVVQFINKYADVKMNDKTKISYLEYDWSLND
jgi:hypothetical protein